MKGLLIIFLFLSYTSVTSANTTSINIKQYYDANCSRLTGTWSGVYTDPTNLFGDGGPWPITISMTTKDNNIIGTIKTPGPLNGDSQLWGTCVRGRLTKIFAGSTNQCGDYAPDGVLISQNMIIMSIPYENAMTGTNFIVTLQRKNNSFTGEIPAVPKLSPRQTCH